MIFEDADFFALLSGSKQWNIDFSNAEKNSSGGRPDEPTSAILRHESNLFISFLLNTGISGSRIFFSLIIFKLIL